jgi:general stress protein 26
MTDKTDTDQKLKAAFWSHLRSDMTVMLKCADTADRARPMTAQLDGDQDAGPIYFFGGLDSGLYAEAADGPVTAEMTFIAKGHGLFASVEGELATTRDRALIDRLWNPYVAAWYEGGKDDPNLILFVLHPREATFWENESSFFAGAKMLLGIDPQTDYEDKMATVNLG